MLAHYGVGLLVDVGANVGQYALAVRAGGYQGSILSIEPAAAAYAVLERAAARDPLWDHQRTAIGDSTGVLALNISQGSIFNSPLTVTDEAVAASPNARIVGHEQVTVQRLDDVLANVSNHDGELAVKIDVQGFERSVIEGADMTLRRARMVEMELSPMAVYAGQMLLDEALDRLSSAGFVLSLVENLFPEPESGRALQFNGIFVSPND